MRSPNACGSPGRTSRGRCTCWSDGGSCAGSPTSTTGGPAPIALTPEGAATAERYLSAVLGRLDEALRDWSAEDRSTFYRLLARFADDLAAHFVEND